MSYGFNIKAANKAAALARLAAECETVVATQSIHAADIPLVKAAAEGFLDKLVEDESAHVNVNVYGSVSYQSGGTTGVDKILGVSTTINVFNSAIEQPTL